MEAAADEPCGCEKIRLRDISPGPVLDNEALHFLVPHPGAIIDGKLTPAFLMQMNDNGLSVLRAHAADEEFRQSLDELKVRWSPKARKFVGVASFLAARVRYDDSRRLCCVYDTALPGKPHHADIAGTVLKAESNTARKKLEMQRIKRFIDLVQPSFQSARDFRGGVLGAYAD